VKADLNLPEAGLSASEYHGFSDPLKTTKIKVDRKAATASHPVVKATSRAAKTKVASPVVLKRAAVAGPRVVAVPVPDNDSYLSDVGEFTGTCPRFFKPTPFQPSLHISNCSGFEPADRTSKKWHCICHEDQRTLEKAYKTDDSGTCGVVVVRN